MKPNPCLMMVVKRTLIPRAHLAGGAQAEGEDGDGDGDEGRVGDVGAEADEGVVRLVALRRRRRREALAKGAS